MDAGAMRTVLAIVRPMDWLLVAVLLLLAWFEIWVEPLFQTGMPGPRLPLTLLAIVALAPLLARRVFPLAAVTTMTLGMLAVGIVGDSDQSTFVLFIGLFVGAYALGAHATTRNALLGAAVVVFTALVLQFFVLAQRAIVDTVVPVFFLGAAWLVGKEVHRQGQRAGELAEHAALLARTHRLEMHAALSAERTRIARELHDVVAHAVSVMGIQAAAARSTLAPGQDAQRRALIDVERLGREALDEMQRMLGVLRTEDDAGGIGPLPGLTQVPALVTDARTAGLEVVLELTGELDELPAGLQLTAYRIVQEALTNVRKHARASGVSIRIARSRSHLEISVADDGEGVAGELVVGNGLFGMRERVATHNGRVYAGPRDGQGFLVRAQLPVKAAE